MGPTKPGWGWPTSPRLESLRDDWFQAETESEQKRICEQMQLQAFEDLPYIPLGLFLRPTAYRRSLVDMRLGLPLFFGVRPA